MQEMSIGHKPHLTEETRHTAHLGKINHLHHHVKHKQSCACLFVYAHGFQPGANLHARRIVTKQR